MVISSLLFFIADSFIVGLTSFCLMGLFRLVDVVEQSVLFLILSSANIIFSTYILSLVGLISPSAFFLIHIFLFCAVFFYRMGQRARFSQKVSLPFELSEIKKHHLIVILGCAIVIFSVSSIILGFLSPPNNWDGMSYHLSRAGYWLQNKTLAHYLTQDTRQLYLMPNAEILILWPIVFLRSEFLAFSPQFISFLGIIGLVFLTARYLEFSPMQSLFASLIWASCTEVLFEATSIQNDLVLTFFLVAGVYFFLKGLWERDTKILGISAISLGLALGTKGTALFIFPGLLFYGVLNMFDKTRGPSSSFKQWLFYVFLAFVFLGSYGYIQNYFRYGYFLGPKIILESHSTFSLLNMIRNIFYIMKRFLDTSGLTFLKIPGFYRDIPFHEDSAGYGLAWLALCLPSLIYFFNTAIKKNNKKSPIIICAVAFLMSFSACLLKDPWLLRLLIPFTALIAPLSGFFYPSSLKASFLNKTKYWYCSIFVVICVIQISTVAFCNPSKPLYVLTFLQKRKVFKDHVSILQMDRYEKRYLPFSDLKLSEMDIYRELDKVSKINDKIGIIASGTDWDYPAFGDHFQRFVFPFIYDSPDSTKRQVLEKELDYLIIFGPSQKFENFNADLTPFIQQLLMEGSGFTLLKKAGDLYLFRIVKVREQAGA